MVSKHDEYNAHQMLHKHSTTTIADSMRSKNTKITAQGGIECKNKGEKKHEVLHLTVLTF